MESDRVPKYKQELQPLKEPIVLECDGVSAVSLRRTFKDFINGYGTVYPMNRGGYCLILNVIQDRKGSAKDGADIKRVFEGFGFEVNEQKDPTINDIEDLLRLAIKSCKNKDCFVCFILCHGDEAGRLTLAGNIGLDKEAYQYDLSNMFTTINAKVLDKPKIWFIQACRGDQIDAGKYTGISDADEHRFVSAHADSLYVFGTVQDFRAFRDPICGSVFIQSLCQILEHKDYRGKSLVFLLTLLNGYVSAERIEATVDDIKRNVMQVIEFKSTLRRDIYLTQDDKMKTPRIDMMLLCCVCVAGIGVVTAILLTRL